MACIDGRVPADADEITTGQANRVWYVPGSTPYVLKHYSDPGRAANEAAALTLLARHRAPSPRLLAADSQARPAWTAQSAIQADPVPAHQLQQQLTGPLAEVHAIAGDHFGRLAGAFRHPTWRAYLTNRLDLYVSTSPDLRDAVQALRRDLDRVNLHTPPRLLHHDLQPGHLVRTPAGNHLLLDWELAAFGDPLSDLARLAVRQQRSEPPAAPTDTTIPDPRRRLDLYWRLHLLADAALASDDTLRAHARVLLLRRE